MDIDFTTYKDAIKNLANQLTRDQYIPDLLILPSRSGLIVGGHLSYLLGISPEVVVMNKSEVVDPQTYRVDTITKALRAGSSLTMFKQPKVLVLDDIVDSGAAYARMIDDLSNDPSQAFIYNCKTARDLVTLNLVANPIEFQLRFAALVANKTHKMQFDVQYSALQIDRSQMTDYVNFWWEQL